MSSWLVRGGSTALLMSRPREERYPLVRAEASTSTRIGYGELFSATMAYPASSSNV